jgi:hypothetical protein
VVEPIWIQGGRTLYPFRSGAGVRPRGYSGPLQRAMTDFGADESFEKAVGKLKEHYGVDVPVSAVREVTLRHGAQMAVEEEPSGVAEGAHQGAVGVSLPMRSVERVIAEVDGSMVPIVQVAPPSEGEPEDGRKRRHLEWNEARLSLARAKGCVMPQFAATLGGPDEAGDQLKHCAIQAGMGKNTTVHCVGDGAPWIADQVERVFGAQGHFLVDFYHLCDYVGAAAKSCAPAAPEPWFEAQKQRLKQGQLDEVLAALSPHQEPAATPEANAPVRRCYRYITNRPDQFDYPAALAAELPLGSGEIESAHRYVIQDRLKIAGAWWKPDNAHCMLALRVNRANGAWNDYWSQQELKQAA